MRKNIKSKTFIHRAKVIVFLCCTASIVMVYHLMCTYGVVEGTAPDAEKFRELMVKQNKYEETFEGVFIDKNGDPITVCDEPGKPAQICDMSYGRLIGLNSPMRGASGGLTEKYFEVLYDADPSSKHGKSIQLTTDNSLQKFCYSLLQEDSAPCEGSIVVIEVKTGKVLAMTSRADGEIEFDPNIADKEIEEKDCTYYDAWIKHEGFLFDRSLMEDDPIGSTGKIITSACLYENDLGAYEYEDTTGEVEEIHNWDFKIWGRQGLEDAFVGSSNTYFAAAGLKLGFPLLVKTTKKFGIGQKLETDFGDLEGIIDTKNYSSKDLATISYGQGIYMSPVQLCTITQGIINDGKMFRPSLIAAIDNKNTDHAGEVISGEISNQTAKKVKKLMRAAAQSYGATDPSYMAKTGTADTYRGTNHIWIAGGDEKFAVVVSHNNSSASSSSLMNDMNAILAYCQSNM